MKNRDAIYASLDLIEENLKSDMTVYSVSQRFGFSLYYFSRLFKGITGTSPKSYMLGRKITEAARELLSTDKKIIEIAFDYGFSTPESFLRAFCRITGMNPSDFRKRGTVEGISLVGPISVACLEAGRYIDSQQPEVVERGPLMLVGIPFLYDGTADDLTTPWQNLIRHRESIITRVVPERYYQVQYWFADQDPGTLFFFVSCEVDRIDTIPVQLTAKTLPAQTYLRFSHRGRANTVGHTYRYIYGTYLPETEYRLPHLYNFEYYPADYAGPYNDNSVSEIYIPVEIETYGVGRPS
ncbi:MAG: AraC family transcriptional regulator [Spirochaetota bacterium]